VQHPLVHFAAGSAAGLSQALAFTGFAPHRVCWLGNPWLIALHAPADLVTFLAYVAIPALVAYVYYKGELSAVGSAFPGLWRLAAAFVGLCGLSHLGNYLEVWYGGPLYWVTGAMKVAMAGASVAFAAQLWGVRDRLVLFGRVLAESARALDAAEAVSDTAEDRQR